MDAEHIETRKEAKGAIELMLAQYPADNKIFWQKIFDLAQDIVQPKQSPRQLINKMTDAESRKFDDTIIPFGKHKGERVRDVSLGYLLFISNPTPFIDNLKRYLNSDRISREIEMGAE